MLQSVLLLAFLLPYSSGDIATKLRSHYSDKLKSTCDGLAYRTVYHESQSESNCYFVIEAVNGSAQTTKQCDRVLAGAKLARDAPKSVYSSLLAKKTDFLGEGESVGKQMNALCVYKSVFPCEAGGLETSDTCVRKEEQKIEYHIYQAYRANFKDEVRPGQVIVLKGNVIGNRHFFHINLCAEDRMKQWHLHIVPNYQAGHTGLTCLKDNVWQNQWVQIYWTHPIVRGVPFEVRITVLEDKFQVDIGKNFSQTFAHRMPISTIKQLYVNFEAYSGASYLDYVHLGESYESFPSPNAMYRSFPICREGGCDSQPCKSMVLTGVYNEGLGSADAGQTIGIGLLYKNGDWGLAFSASILWNTCSLTTQMGFRDRWGPITTVNQMPFKKNVPFEITIRREPTAYQISVNGKHFVTYPHRQPAWDIHRITTRGIEDVAINFK